MRSSAGGTGRTLAFPGSQSLAALACRKLGSGLDRTTPLTCPGLEMTFGPVALHQQFDGSARTIRRRGHETQNDRSVAESDALGGRCGRRPCSAGF